MLNKGKRKKKEFHCSIWVSECCQHLFVVQRFRVRNSFLFEKSNLNAIITMIAWQMESKLGLFVFVCLLLVTTFVSLFFDNFWIRRYTWRRIRIFFSGLCLIFQLFYLFILKFISQCNNLVLKTMWLSKWYINLPVITFQNKVLSFVFAPDFFFIYSSTYRSLILMSK